VEHSARGISGTLDYQVEFNIMQYADWGVGRFAKAPQRACGTVDAQPLQSMQVIETVMSPAECVLMVIDVR